MNPYKKYSFYALTVPPLLFVVFIVFMLGYDPLQLYHKPFFERKWLDENMRQQDAGIIKNYEFDSIILGSSYMENNSAADAERAFGGKFFNLSISGSTNYERDIILQRALRKNLKTVITQVDPNTRRTGSQDYPLELWDFLYDDSALNDFRVYFDLHFLQNILTGGKNADFDRPKAWHNDAWFNSRLGGLDKWIANHKNRQVADFLHNKLPSVVEAGVQAAQPLGEERKKEILLFIDEVIRKPALDYPETRFLYIFPPFSRLFYAVQYYKGENEYDFWVRSMAQLGSELPNLKVYAYSDRDFPDDIANYIDPNHFAEWINAWIVEAMARNEGRLTQENVEEYLRRVNDKAKAFDLEGFARRVKEVLPPLS